MKDQVALVGRTLGHSYSPEIHRLLAGKDYDYGLREVEPEGLEPLLRDPAYLGFNVTIPYKIDAMKVLDEISPKAERIGCVNTIVRRPDGSLFGDNTDYDGFRYLIERTGIDPAGKKCLILGSGGSSRTVRTVLTDLGAKETVIISRSGENNYQNLDRHRDAGIIVNTTPVGMYPNVGNAPLSLEPFPEVIGVLDLIYNPYRTDLVLDAEKRGIPAAGGLPMLVAQAEAGCRIFLGREPDGLPAEQVLDQLSRSMQNIVLIGMPGAGKSTVGRRIAEKEGRRLIDTDEEIVRREGVSIEQIFREHGEAYFRSIETEVLREACAEKNVVIAAGGGVVTQPENYNIIRRNSRVGWVQRDLSRLPVSGRPISKRVPPETLFEQRKQAYESWSDFVIDNNERKG